MGRRRRSFAVAVLLAALVALVPSAGGAAPANPPRHAARIAPAEGIRTETDTTYRVRPRRGVVSVEVRATLTNQQPPQASGGFTRSFYLPELGVPILSEATNLAAAHEGGGALSVRTQATEVDWLSVAVIDLSPDLQYPSTQRVRFTYDLPNLPARSDGLTRVNSAFVTFPAFAVGDPELTDLRVVIPSGYEVEFIGNALPRTSERGGEVIYEVSGIDNPDTFTAVLVGRDDDQLVSRPVDLGDHDVVVKGWPGDRGWADFVARTVRRAVPLLQDMVGLPWPITTADLLVVETVSPYLYGYAGWYLDDSYTIEVGDELDRLVIVHELAHVWFNDELFSDRWVNEGLAEDFATRVLRRLDERVDRPGPVRRSDPGAIALNAWSNPTLLVDDSREQELYGYNASRVVIGRIVDDIGIDGMRTVIQAAKDKRLSYLGTGEPETTNRPADWQRFLDLIEEVGGSREARSVFGEHVVTDSERPLLRRRDTLRREYRKLVAAGGEWAPPFEVRLALTDWRFDHADHAIDDAHQLLGLRDELDETLEGSGLAPVALENGYETAADLAAVIREAAGAISAAEAVLRARDEVDGGHDIVTTVGLWFSSADGRLDRAYDAFAAGDYAEATSAAEAAIEGAEDAARAGQIRLAVAAFALLVAGLGTHAVRLRRRERAERALAVAAAQAAEAPPA